MKSTLGSMLTLQRFRFLLGFRDGPWVQVDCGGITTADVAEFSTFVGALHWPAGAGDVVHYGVSYLEVLILFEQWAGHRLFSEKVTGPNGPAHHPIFPSSVPVSGGIEIRLECWFISSQVRAPGKLPASLGRNSAFMGR